MMLPRSYLYHGFTTLTDPDLSESRAWLDAIAAAAGP